MSTRAPRAETKSLGVVKEWRTGEATSYREDDYYTRSADERGHSTTTLLRLPPDVMGMAEEIVQLRKFPYRTVQDIIRDGILHRIQYLRGVEDLKETDAMFARVLTIQKILDEEDRAKEHGEVMKRLPGILDDLLQDPVEGTREAIRVLESVLANISAMPDGYWKKQYSSQIRHKYGHLLKG